ncbi:MAG: GntR family transcriptional regulator [Clostridiales Family XIII bacterium]|jgi:DNA-binding GntR family transcriptional regulator|nr:GntR family transcriptional regulator [Clostridiales Family XIII bacterium]
MNDITEMLRADILREKIRIGSKLTERDICEAYGVSRTPVREALRDLKNEDLVELIPNHGAYVSGFTLSDMRDLFVLREILEAQCTAWAIERITTDELETLEKKYEFLELYTHRGDTTKLKKLDAEFHTCIHAASQNRILIRRLSAIQNYVKYSAVVKTRRKENIQAIFEEHAAIFEAFIARDPVAGEAAARAHIRNAAVRAGL